MEEIERDKLGAILDSLTDKINNDFNIRIKNWKFKIEEREIHEVVGGLLSRQFTLALQLASTSQLWNYHIATIILRVMIDNFIQLSWILKSPLERSQRFIYYGLGQEKLILEHRKKYYEENKIDPSKDKAIIANESWINSQRFSFLTDVNVGSWADIDTRKMAKEIGEESLYYLCFLPFNSSIHNNWYHISRYNLKECANPLHGGHKIPIIAETHYDVNNLLLALKYLDMVIEKFDEYTKFKPEVSYFREFLRERLDELGTDKKT